MLSKSQVKYIQSLGHKKQRDEDGVFIVEGPKLIAEMVAASPADLLAVYALSVWIERVPVVANLDKLTVIDEQDLAKISQLSTPNSGLAIFRQMKPEPIIIADRVTLLLDRIQDPGNLGTIIRIADWFGVRQIACAEGTADKYNPKTVQSTMGSIARVQVEYVKAVEWLSSKGAVLAFGTTLEGADVRKMEKLKEGIIVIGNESKGIDEQLIALLDHQITIPRIGGAESLNAAVATGIVLSHLT